MSLPKLLVMGAIVALAAAWLLLDAGRLFSLTHLQEARDAALGFVEQRPLAWRVGYFGLYVAVAAASLPGAAALTLAGGALFGLWQGLALASFASSIGATLAFLAARVLLGEWVQRRFEEELRRVNAGFERDGVFYLFSLRMTPLFPFFVVNLAMGLTRMRVLPFYLTSQAGMFAGTFLFVFAGTQLMAVQGMGDILSPGLIVALTLLGVFPIAAKKLLQRFGPRRTGSSVPSPGEGA